jgi:osmotically-inducible protein OsmY
MRLLSVTLLFALVLTPLLAQKDKTPITDDIIVDQVKVKLADDSEVGGQPIQVDAHGGTVVLTG